jgi:SOS-response transcriptional repressor LexA
MCHPIHQRPLATQIRERREQLGFSLRYVAEHCGCSPSTLWQIEQSGRGLPSDDTLAKLEFILDLRAGSLIEKARWQRTLDAGGDELREELDTLSQRSKAGQRLASLLRSMQASTGAQRTLDEAYRSGTLRSLIDTLAPEPARSNKQTPTLSRVDLPLEVPLINNVAAGYPRHFTDMGYPARVADEYVRCPDLADADAFAARVVGDSMQPAYAEGDIVIFSPAKSLASGMDCFARLEPDSDTTFKRVFFEKNAAGEDLIRLQPLNPAYPPRTVPREHIAGLYAAVRVIKKIG